MYLIPRFFFFIVLGWKTFINSLSVFELLPYLARLIIKFFFRYKSFPLAYFPDCFIKSTTTKVVEIEMVPIHSTSEQTLRRVYFSII